MLHKICTTSLFCTILVLSGFALSAQPISTSPKGGSISIIEPKQGAELIGPFQVRFSLSRMMLMPAGVPHTDAGHIHLQINGGDLPQAGSVIPKNKNTIDLHKGERQTQLNLPPGKYTLRAVLGDHLDRLHQPPIVSEQISITIKAPTKAKSEK